VRFQRAGALSALVRPRYHNLGGALSPTVICCNLGGAFSPTAVRFPLCLPRVLERAGGTLCPRCLASVLERAGCTLCPRSLASGLERAGGTLCPRSSSLSQLRGSSLPHCDILQLRGSFLPHCSEVQGCCSLCGVGQPRPCQLLLLDGLRGRRRAEGSLSSLCAQGLLSVWSEAAEVMPAVVAGWLAGGEEPRCPCLISGFKCCSRCGLRQPRSCQLLLLDGLQGR